MTIRPVNLGAKFDPPSAAMLVWDHLKAREAGDSLDTSLYRKISIQVEGEFDGATVNIEGSNDGEHWYALIDTQDNHFKFSFPGMADVGQMSRFLRPVVMGGGDMTDVTVFALCRGLR